MNWAREGGLSRWLNGALCLIGLLLGGGAGAVEQVVYYHTDALGSPVAGTDAAGHLLWRESYLPQGERRTYTSRETQCSAGVCRPVESQADEKLWYTGKFEEPGVGLVYLGARWYDPELGRFLSPDPAGYDPGVYESFNRYAYGNNNPYRYVDPDGKSPIEMWVFLGADIASAGMNLAEGNWGMAAWDAANVVLDVQPFPGPSEVSHGIKAAEWGTKAGRAAEAAADGAKVANEAGGQVFQRVVSNAELKATQDTGLLRGGRAGENFFTDAASLDAKRAQQRLALDGPLRDQRIKFRITNDAAVSGPRVAPGGRSGTPGGGREFSTNGPTQIEILRTDPLRR